MDTFLAQFIGMSNYAREDCNCANSNTGVHEHPPFNMY